MSTSSDTRKAKTVKPEDVEYFINLTPEDCLKTSIFMDTFGTFNGKCKYNTYDILTVPKGSYHNNKNDFVTTLGRWFFNKGVIEYSGLFDILGYFNKEFNKKNYKAINAKLSTAILEDRVTVPQFKKFINALQKYMPYSSAICPTTTEEMMNIGVKLKAKKKELFKKYEKELNAGDAITMNKIEKELLDYSNKLLEGNPGMDMIDAGAGADWGNNFKNMYVVKGAQKDPDPTKGYNIILSNYAEGISKEDYTKMANSLAAGPYSRACKTASGGYMEKLFLSAFQHVMLDKKGSDCGTKRTITITLDKDMLALCMYSYIVEGNKLVRLDSTNADKYLGKTVKMRFSSLCEHEKICNKCAGDLYYLLGVSNVGTATPQLASCVKNISMKAFHDSTEKYIKMDANEAFGLK